MYLHILIHAPRNTHLASAMQKWASFMESTQQHWELSVTNSIV
jgi:hypothetical protein